MITWLSEHKFQAHLTAFVLMVLASVGMILTTQAETSFMFWVLLVFFISANILAMFVK